MGFLERTIKRSVSRAVGNAVEQGVRRAVEPKIEQAASNVVNSAANKFNNAVGSGTTEYAEAPQGQTSFNTGEINQAAGTLGGALGSLTGAMTTFANEAAKKYEIMPLLRRSSSGEYGFLFPLWQQITGTDHCTE